MANEVISFYSKNPPNKYIMEDFTVKYKEENRSCSDTIEVFLKIDEDTDELLEWSFEWITSIITTATASIFWESIIGMDVYDVLDKWYDYIVELIGEEVSQRRQKSAIFWILATRNAIHKYLEDDTVEWFFDVLAGTDEMCAW